MKGLFMKFIYLFFRYVPKYKYGSFIHLGHFETKPLVFEKYSDALKYKRSYKHTGYICKVKLR